MRNNPVIQQEISRLSNKVIAEMIVDYRQGTGLTLRDLSHKYNVTLATACFIVKQGNS